MSKNATKEYYDKRWSSENSFDSPPNSERVNRIANACENICVTIESPKILDVGCGNGWIIQAVFERIGSSANYFGLEPSLVGTKNSATRNPTATIRQGFLGDVVFPHSDITICSEVLEHIDSQFKFLEDLVSTLKPEGHLVLTTPNLKMKHRYFNETPVANPQPIENWVDSETLTSWFTQLGFVSEIIAFGGHFKKTLPERLFGKIVKMIGNQASTTTSAAPIDHSGLYLFAIAKRKSDFA